MLDTTLQTSQKLKVVVIDDDPVFGNVLALAGSKYGVYVKYFGGLDEIEPRTLQNADLVVLDFDLGTTTGLEIGRRLEDKQVEAPILLVSSTQDAFKAESWPKNMRNFAAKSLGPFGVLDTIRQVIKPSVALQSS